MDIEALPKAVLHDHLDGGLRIGTVLELADASGYRELPAWEPGALAAWFHQGESGSLERYLEAFRHTIAVMRTPEALERVAVEAVEDLAGDGARYAEVRFGPALHAPVRPEGAIEAVLSGLAKGSVATGCATGLIVTALRQSDDSELVARAAARFAGEGVVGFDLAGPEQGHPADRHLPACRIAREAGLGLTIHAGEGDGPESIWRAVGRCAAMRVGHGARIVDDTRLDDGNIVELGGLARAVRDLRIPLELCITSNLHTGLCARAEDHPFASLWRAGFAVTINTDNRLMSGIGLADEYRLARDITGMSLADLGRIVVRTVEAGFGDWSVRRGVVEEVERAYGLA